APGVPGHARAVPRVPLQGGSVRGFLGHHERVGPAGRERAGVLDRSRVAYRRANHGAVRAGRPGAAAVGRPRARRAVGRPHPGTLQTGGMTAATGPFLRQVSGTLREPATGRARGGREWSSDVCSSDLASVPVYWTEAGLPIGVQIMGQFGRDDLVLRLSADLERAAPWAGRIPARFKQAA